MLKDHTIKDKITLELLVCEKDAEDSTRKLRSLINKKRNSQKRISIKKIRIDDHGAGVFVEK